MRQPNYACRRCRPEPYEPKNPGDPCGCCNGDRAYPRETPDPETGEPGTMLLCFDCYRGWQSWAADQAAPYPDTESATWEDYNPHSGYAWNS